MSENHKNYTDSWNPGALTPVTAHVLTEVKRELAWRFEDLKSGLAEDDISDLVKNTALRLGFELSGFEKDEILQHLESDSAIFSILQPLIEDTTVTDIVISSFCKIAIQRSRRNILTGIAFADSDSYEAFVERLLLKAGISCTTKQPIADGMIGPYVRLHVVHKSLCEEGPYVTIRINRFTSVTLNDLVAHGLAPEPVFRYLEALLFHGKTVLIAGEVGTGKTTLARALASSIPESESILVIEDTPEIRLQHPHVRYMVTRSENFEGTGRITPAQCIRAGMRMAMNRIVFGEIRDAEAAEAFIDVCASGHPGLSTIHARSSSEAIARMELFLGRAQRGVQHEVLTSQIATAVQIVCVVDLCPETGKRRIMEVREIGPVADDVLRYREIFRYHVENGFPKWKIGTRVSVHRDCLENGPHTISLSTFPADIELDAALLYKELSAQNVWG